jgi:hypothetical protein
LRSAAQRCAAGHNIFSAFPSRCKDTLLASFTSTVVTDDKVDAFKSDGDDDDSFTAPDPANIEGEAKESNSNVGGIQDPKDSTPTPPSQDAEERPNLVPFDLDHDNPATNLNSQDDVVSTLDDKSELLR